MYNDIMGAWIVGMVGIYYPDDEVNLLPVTFEDGLLSFHFQGKKFVATAPTALCEWGQKQAHVVFSSPKNKFTGIVPTYDCPPLRDLCQMYCGAGCNEENITLKIKVDTLLVFLRLASVAVVTLPPAMKEWAEKYKVTELKIKNGMFTMK